MVTSGGFICANLVQGMAVLGDATYVPKPWATTLILWAVVLLAVSINTIVSRALPKIESLIMILHIVGYFAVLIPLVYLAPQGKASDVFTVFLNEGGWPTKGLSSLVGLLGPVFAFGGADGAVHVNNAKPIIKEPGLPHYRCQKRSRTHRS